ncbi:hypothetical protein G3M53_78665, partial [Streptomyces sp. SID7982]|nr:hypothetical protein [Streptomyces sp. SID7982]
MTKKTRVRVARIAAGAVIAAGASLTAAGAAQALDLDGSGEQSTVTTQDQTEDEGLIGELIGGGGPGGVDEGQTTTGETTGETTTGET